MHHTRSTWVKPSQKSGIVWAECGRYACSRPMWFTRSGVNDMENLKMLGEENKAVVRLFEEQFWNKGNLAAVDELMTAEATIVLPGMGQVDLATLKAFAAG